MDRVREWAVSCFYLGEFPFASGTVGSLGAVALYLLAALRLEGATLSLAAGAAGVVFAAIGIALGHWAQVHYDNRDPRQFVLDEAAGQMFALVAVTPLVMSVVRWKAALAAFLFFRVCDVIKPFPASRAEALNAGWGIVLDDVIAGLYAAALTHLWFHFIA
ncbi:MAG TPA: phosphatidylglycerophosphatase A [Planctomycetota bacterium]|nr:phosphatidylglycerophosphatase A [Planctomycetota bacterium]HRR79675.1 phosphatidylglycerophosphatase A [Planctomycetota bacterium]